MKVAKRERYGRKGLHCEQFVFVFVFLIVLDLNKNNAIVLLSLLQIP